MHRLLLNSALLLGALTVAVAPAFLAPGTSVGQAVPGRANAAGQIATKAEAQPPNVLLITVDTLRRDALGWLGGSNDTPELDRLAAEGFRFPTAVTPVPITLPAHTSLFTGLVPKRHGVRDNGRLVSATPPTLAERLGEKGYRTAAFVSGFPLESIFGLDRGFDHYDDEFPDGRRGFLERRAADTAAAAAEWIRSQDGAPWFVWVHFYDPHDPYEPPREFWRPGPRGSYDGEVAYVDYAVGELRRALPQQPRDTLTIFTADHGEGLGEHGEDTHGYFIYDSTVVVPLVLHWPGRLDAGESDFAARLVDVSPTVLDLLGAPPLPGVDGVTLRPVLEGETSPSRPALVETRLPWLYFGWAPLEALRYDDWKLIVAPRPELYDLVEDPGETANRIDDERRRARSLIGELRRLGSRPAADAAEVDDPETLARLQSLGYVGAGSSDNEPPPGLPDPKDRIDLRRRLLAAEELLKAGRRDAAARAFEEVLAVEPENRFAMLRAGIALLDAGRLPAATRRLEGAVALDPDRVEARFALGDALQRQGRWAEAIPQWMELVRLQPRRFQGWANLATALAAEKRPGDAAEAATRAVELAPEEARLRLDLVRYLQDAGDTEAAKASLKAALAAHPDLRAGVSADPRFAPLLSP